MDDELEERVLKQVYVSHIKFLSRFAFNVFEKLPRRPSSSSLHGLMRALLRPEVFLAATVVVFLLCLYYQTELGAASLLKRLYWHSRGASVSPLQLKAERDSWEQRLTQSAVYAIQGRRNHMEDRFFIEERINESTSVAIFALFDGHGGDHAADYAKDVFIKSLRIKIAEIHELNKSPEASSLPTSEKDCKEEKSPTPQPQPLKNDPDILDKVNSKGLQALKQPQESQSPPPVAFPARCYISDRLDYKRLITDEIHVADHRLVEMSRRKMIIAGSTALIALVDGSRLIVANVGDSRGVMCDHLGHSVPLSFDHRPQAAREHRRIQEAGGFIAFKGVWRVSGILATSRSLGDYPLKPKLVIATPDILEFELADHRPQFVILASDGLWDTFSNEEAVAFVKSRLSEPHFGAKSLTLEAYARGSVDNITVIVVVFRNGKFEAGGGAK